MERIGVDETDPPGGPSADSAGDVPTKSVHALPMQRRSTTRGLAPLGAILPTAAGRGFRSRGFAHAAVLSRWREIVGESIASSSCPERLSFPGGAAAGGTLRVRVAGGLAVELQHLEPVVLERLNGFLGYSAVARLSLAQGPIPRSYTPPEPPRRTPTAEEAERIDTAAATAADPELRSALRSLGRSMLARPPA